MSDLEQTAIERLKATSDMSLRLFEKPLVITYSGGKDSDVLLHLAEASGIPFEVLHSLTTADAPETVRHVYDTFRRLEEKGVKCTVDKHVQLDGSRVTMWNLIPRKLIPPMRIKRYCCAELKEGGGKAILVPCDDEGNLHDAEYLKRPYSGIGYMIRHTHENNPNCPIAVYEVDGGIVGGVYIYDTPEEATEAWNRREERT